MLDVRVQLQVVQQPQFALPGAQQALDGGGVALVDVDADGGVAFGEPPQQAWQVEGGEGLEAADGQVADELRAEAARRFGQLVGVREEAAQLVLEALARGRQLQPLGVPADEELDAEFAFEVGHGGGDGGLGDVDALGRGGHGAELGGGEEVAQLHEGEIGVVGHAGIFTSRNPMQPP